MYHGILVDQSFKDINFPRKFKIFGKKQDGSWGIYGIEIEEKDLNSSISEIQKNMKVGTWYAHFYNDDDVIVIFKKKVFWTPQTKLSWRDVYEYGKNLNIKQEQLDFVPNKFEDEGKYFPIVS